MLRFGKKALQRFQLRITRILRRVLGGRTGGDHMSEVIATVRTVQERFEPPVHCIETGTIRSYHEQHESTRKIGEKLEGRGFLTSVDISPESIAISKDICQELSNVTWVESDSITYLSGLKDQTFHFALLDSVNDPSVIFQEFRLVLPFIPNGGVIMVDDAGIRPDGAGTASEWNARKGHRVWTVLRRANARFEVVTLDDGTGTQLRIPIDASNRNRIMAEIGRLGGKDA